MREIKFRAWDKENRKMLIFEDGRGLALTFYSDGSRLLTQDLGEDIINDFEVMQYTGLKDRNSVEIFEGDIVKMVHGEKIFQVKYRQAGFIFWNDKPDLLHPNHTIASNCYIIGNIWENPDLITNSKHYEQISNR